MAHVDSLLASYPHHLKIFVDGVYRLRGYLVTVCGAALRVVVVVVVVVVEEEEEEEGSENLGLNPT